MTRLLACVCAVGVAAVSACSVSAQSTGGTGSKPVRENPAQTSGAQPVEGEVPADTLDKLRAEVASQQGVSEADVKVVSAQSVIWPNGALGCAQPGQMYTQMTVPGYRVELEASGRRFVYHASQKGQFKVCPRSSPSTRPVPAEAAK